MNTYELYCDGGETYLGLRRMYADQAQAMRARGYILMLVQS